MRGAEVGEGDVYECLVGVNGYLLLMFIAERRPNMDPVKTSGGHTFQKFRAVSPYFDNVAPLNLCKKLLNNTSESADAEVAPSVGRQRHFRNGH